MHMKIHIENSPKRVYSKPLIKSIKLDNEISLALESTPAVGPNEGAQNSAVPEFFKDSPFKSHNC